MASVSGVSATRCWNMWTTERNAGSVFGSVKGKAPVSLQLEQRVSRIHRLARLDVDLGHRAFVLGADLVLHLHGFEHKDTLAGVDFLALLHEEGDDAARHVGLDG